MENNKNINVTLLTSDNQEESNIKISFSSMLIYMKKFFVWWLIISLILAFASSGISILKQKSSYVGNLDALVKFDYEGIEKGLAPDGTEIDVSKIKSPSIIEKALTSLQLSNANTDKIRNNIDIISVMPQDAVDEMNLYYKVYSKTASIQSAKSLIETEYHPEQYIISFNYFNCNYTLGEGTEILNAILNTYSSYFFETYSYNASLGSAVSVVDYTEYDYAEAANIFNNTLEDIQNYISSVSKNDTNNFRSSETGYTFDDLKRNVYTLINNDLDQITSYITINSVTNNDIKSMISYYQYLIKDITRKKSIEVSTLTSINESIQKYEKDPLVLIIGNENEENDEDYINKAYDDLMYQKIDTQTKISKYSRNINYYNNIIESFSKSSTVKQKDIDEVNDMLSKLNDKVKNLINNVNKTVDEYYSKVAFANSFKILVPASGSETEVTSKSSLTSLFICEIAVLLVYIAVSFMLGIIDSNKSKFIALNTEDNTSTVENASTDENTEENKNTAEKEPQTEDIKSDKNNKNIQNRNKKNKK